MAAAAVNHLEEQARNLFAFSGVEPSPDSIFILLLGMTGSGKSTFISQCTGKDARVGHDLDSCTTDISIYDFQLDNQTVYLIDSPGFDDSDPTRTDLDTLSTIAAHLSASYVSGVLLSGIIFLHRIADVRLTGSARRNIEMLKAMCGPSPGCLRHVAVATTFWSGANTVSKDTLEARESQLFAAGSGAFTPLVLGGAAQFRHYEGDSRASALHIVRHFVARAGHGERMVLRLQKEMVDEGKLLSDTEAGRAVIGETTRAVNELREQLEGVRKELRRALDGGERQKQTAEMLKEMKRDMEQEIEGLISAQREISLGVQEMAAKEQAMLISRLDHAEERLRRDMKERKRQLRDLETELQNMRSNAAEAEERHQQEQESFRALELEVQKARAQVAASERRREQQRKEFRRQQREEAEHARHILTAKLEKSQAEAAAAERRRQRERDSLRTLEAELEKSRARADEAERKRKQDRNALKAQMLENDRRHQRQQKDQKRQSRAQNAGAEVTRVENAVAQKRQEVQQEEDHLVEFLGQSGSVRRKVAEVGGGAVASAVATAAIGAMCCVM